MKTILPAALDRIRTSRLAPEHFIKGFAALLAVVNNTGETDGAININYTDENEAVGPDELVPIITLSFRTKESNEKINQANAQGTKHEIQNQGGRRFVVVEGPPQDAQGQAPDGSPA